MYKHSMLNEDPALYVAWAQASQTHQHDVSWIRSVGALSRRHKSEGNKTSISNQVRAALNRHICCH